jgi:RNA polymerase sigma-70 factor (ECF subfamily)
VTWNAAATRRRLRWARRRASLAELDARAQPADEEPPLDERVDARRLAGLARAALAELPARQRAVFDLADLQGHSPAEVAELLGMNPVTVRVHLMRARRAVRARVLAGLAAPVAAPAGEERMP